LLATTGVILLTGRQGPEALAEGHAAGADYYLTKPFSPLQLLTTIEACLGATRESTAGLTLAGCLAVASAPRSTGTAPRTHRGVHPRPSSHSPYRRLRRTVR